jgi:phage terminase large subunit-like protein
MSKPKRKPVDDFEDVELGRIAAEIETATADAQYYRRKDFWVPYPKQSEFFASGALFRERGLFGGTQVGKTETGAFEMACHLTGDYPPDWPGRKWDRAIRAWAVGENMKMLRDIIQRKLCGEPGDLKSFGSGMIPRGAFVGGMEGQVLAHGGEKNCFDTIYVKHVSGGTSVLKFRSYSAGAVALQGESLDLVWCDEDPGDDAVYSECLARTAATGGMLMITFTPLQKPGGSTSHRYLQEFSPQRTFVKFGLKHIPPDGHVKPEDRPALIASYPEHERAARVEGEPMLGQGRIFLTPEEKIIEDADPLSWPTYWTWGWAMDLGISHPWAGALMCHDLDQDVLHLVAELRIAGQTPGVHVSMMRQVEMRLFGRHMDIPVAYPSDAGTRDRGSGEAMKTIYKQFQLRLMAEHATHKNQHGPAAVSVEAGIQEMIVREGANKWKVQRSCPLWLDERRGYHRKDNEIVKVRDDLLDASRYGMMMKRFFKPRTECDPGFQGTPWSGGGGSGDRRGGGTPQFARGSPSHPDGDIDPFTGR